MKALVIALFASATVAFGAETNIVIRFVVVDGKGTNAVDFAMPTEKIAAVQKAYTADATTAKTGGAEIAAYTKAKLIDAIQVGLDKLAADQRPYPLITNVLTGKLFPLRSLDDQYAFQAFLEQYGLNKPGKVDGGKVESETK